MEGFSSVEAAATTRTARTTSDEFTPPFNNNPTQQAFASLTTFNASSPIVA